MKRPIKRPRKLAFTPAQLRIIDARIDQRVNERVSAKLAGLKATFAGRNRRGGCC